VAFTALAGCFFSNQTTKGGENLAACFVTGNTALLMLVDIALWNFP
jgi:hypothetical protein